ncbi:MAG: lysylphosphatidylglycerol synthase transmembrane domain-containing protein [Gaiellales bacterium]
MRQVRGYHPTVRIALGAALGTALLIVALRLRSAAGDVRGVLPTLANAAPAWLAIAAALESLSYLSQGEVLSRLTARLLGLATATRVMVASLGVGSLLPGQPVPAGAIAYPEMRRAGMATGRATAAATAAIVLVPACSMLLLAGPALTVSGLFVSMPPGWAGTVIAAGVIALLLTTAGAVALAMPTLRRRLPTVGAVSDMGRSAPALLGFGLVAWLCDAGCLWATGHALHVSLPPAAFPVAYVTATAIIAAPVLPGGLGGVELAVPLVFAASGASIAQAVLAVLVWRVLAFWLPAIAGVVSFVSLERDPLWPRPT